MDLTTIQQSLTHAFQDYLGGLIARIPSVVSGVLVLLIGWLFAKLLRAVVRRVAEGAGLDRMAERSGIDKVLSKAGVKKASVLLAGLAYVLVLLVFVVASAEVMHMEGVSKAIDRFFGYLPRLGTALAILIAGFWAADLVKARVSTLMETIGLGGGKMIANGLFGVIVLFMSITALNVAGIDTTLITSNLLIVVGGVLLAFCIAYGFAARDVLKNILGSYYGKDRFKPGMRVRLGEDEGVIERIDSISVAIRAQDRLVLLPTSRLITERIEILDEGSEESK